VGALESFVIEAREFGASLRRERELRGISLDEIAAQTKVSASLLAGLEHGDLSRWPTGIFRRSFLRSYAKAIGVDVDTTFAEFLRVFPEDGGPVRPRGAATSHALRLTLDQGHWSKVGLRTLAGAGIDALAMIVSGAVAWAAGPAWWGPLLVALVALVWHGGGAVAFGMSPGAWLTRARHQVVRVAEAGEAKPAASQVGTLALDNTSEDRQQASASREALRLPTPTSVPARARIPRRDRRGGRPDRTPGSDTRLQ
jgi:transcriptional regulator with XRE-family HTH domain